MTVREAVPGDSEAVREVHRRSIEGLGPAAYEPEQVAAWAAGCASADYAPRIRDADAFLVAEREAIVGLGSLSLASPEGYEADPDAEVTGVYVLPEVAREGVGSALYEALERRARSAGAQVLGLTASRNAVPFYEGKGYERVCERDHEFSPREDTGVTGIVVEMVKPLAAKG